MLRMCKIRNMNTCYGCIDYQVDDNIRKDCKTCDNCESGWEILAVGNTFWYGPWAIVEKDGVIKRVRLDQVFDVVTIGRGEW